MNKPLKVEFAPGCFDHFDGTQEELDEFMQELQTMFTELSPEELMSRSRPLSEEEMDELPKSVKEQLRSFLEDDDEVLADHRNLQ